MGEALFRSVGLGGKNLRDDTVKVQQRLVFKGYTLGKVDGQCGKRTIAAIVSFQGTFLRKPDGLVSPEGPTWLRLAGTAAPAGSGTAPTPPSPALKPPIPQGKRSDKFTELVAAPPKNTINVGLTAVSNDFMSHKLGLPRETFGADCQPMTNQVLKARLVTDSAGPFRVTGLKPVVESLKLVMGDVREKLPELYSVLGTAGMLCCRYVRGSNSAISNHSWGTAVDLTLSGKLDIRGDGKVQSGLTLLAPIFNARNWYWGAGFPIEDGMHFEPSLSLLNQLLP
jgi:hypothetical protein